MPRPIHDLRVHGAQDRRSDERVKLPWISRWTLDGLRKSKSFRTKAEADRYCALLVLAARDGEMFDLTTGEPESWGDAPLVEAAEAEPVPELQLYDWARRWLGEQWIEWAPRTRASAIETLTKLVLLGTDVPPPVRMRDQLRRYVKYSLPPDAIVDDAVSVAWLAEHSLTLSAIDRIVTGRIDHELALRNDGNPVAATTANRVRIVARACILAAADAGLIAGDPWPIRSRGRARRKVARKKQLDIRKLPGPATMSLAIDAITSDKPGSENYRVMTAVVYYAGLRPSEVAMLRVGAVELPADGWGKVHVVEADISNDESGEPKTGHRTVPIPPVLVAILRDWISGRGLKGKNDLLFRTATGTRPAQSNWGRAWRRALVSIGQPPLRVYDCRHAAATTWLRSGLPLGETARRMGHSVDTLVNNYVGALQEDDDVGNSKIERFLDGTSER